MALYLLDPVFSCAATRTLATLLHTDVRDDRMRRPRSLLSHHDSRRRREEHRNREGKQAQVHAGEVTVVGRCSPRTFQVIHKFFTISRRRVCVTADIPSEIARVLFFVCGKYKWFVHTLFLLSLPRFFHPFRYFRGAKHCFSLEVQNLLRVFRTSRAPAVRFPLTSIIRTKCFHAWATNSTWSWFDACTKRTMLQSDSTVTTNRGRFFGKLVGERLGLLRSRCNTVVTSHYFSGEGQNFIGHWWPQNRALPKAQSWKGLRVNFRPRTNISIVFKAGEFGFAVFEVTLPPFKV